MQIVKGFFIASYLSILRCIPIVFGKCHTAKMLTHPFLRIMCHYFIIKYTMDGYAVLNQYIFVFVKVMKYILMNGSIT